LADENRKLFVGKGEIGKIFHGVRKFFGNWGRTETGGNASLPQRGWMPLVVLTQTSRLLNWAYIGLLKTADSCFAMFIAAAGVSFKTENIAFYYRSNTDSSYFPPVADPGGANPAIAPPSKLAMEFGPPLWGRETVMVEL